MRAFAVTAALTSGVFLTARAQLVPFLAKTEAPTPLQNQVPIAGNDFNNPSVPAVKMPGTDDKSTSASEDLPPPNPDILISDILGAQRRINIFASFTRDINPVASRLDTARLNTTLLAPSNGAVSSLPHKPWEDPEEYNAMGAKAYEGSDGESRAHANLRRFVEAHVVEASPWEEGEKAKTLRGEEVWWEKAEGGKMLVQPQGVEVEGVVGRAGNGEVWVLKEVLNYKK